MLTTVGRAIFNSAVVASLEEYFGEEWEQAGPEGTIRRDDYEFQNKVFTKNEMSTFVSDLVEYYGAIAVAHLLDVLKDMGFKYASVAGVTISKNDIVVPPDKEEILAGYEAEVRGDPGRLPCTATSPTASAASGSPTCGPRPPKKWPTPWRRTSGASTRSS